MNHNNSDIYYWKNKQDISKYNLHKGIKVKIIHYMKSWWEETHFVSIKYLSTGEKKSVDIKHITYVINGQLYNFL